MSTWTRCLFLLAMVALCLATTGCSETEQPSASATQESTQTATPVEGLGGLLVTVETTSGPGPNIFDDQNPSTDDTPPAEGKVRLTVIANATNSSETTLGVQVKHNFPAVWDADGEYMQNVGGSLSASNSSASGDYLGPGGVLRTVQYFDVDPEQTGFRITWDFGELGEYESLLP